MDRRLAPISVLVLGSASCEERPYFRDPAALVCFANPLDCTAKPAGTRARNPAYARTLAAIALRGATPSTPAPSPMAIPRTMQTSRAGRVAIGPSIKAAS